jgi:outer membrane protein assembly factor BamB
MKPMPTWTFRLALVLNVLMLCSIPIRAEQPKGVHFSWTKAEVESAGDGFWPQFRGPEGDGHALPNADPPVRWSETENLGWRIDIPGKAWSSPVAWGNTLWITTASEDGLKMSAMAIDRKQGKILWDKVVFTNTETQKDFHQFNSYGSPTPVLDGQHLYVSFGAYGTAALNRNDGSIVWQRRDLPCNHFRGPGSSPILYKDMLIFHMDGFDYQYVVALNKRTGETVWKKDRTVEYGTDDGDIKKAFSTPLIIEAKVPGSDQPRMEMISTTSKAVLAYDPKDGTELWRVRYEEFSSTARPVFDGRSTLFISTGFSKAKMLAIGLGGSGDVTQTHVKWESARAIGSKPSPILLGETLIVLDDRGVLSALQTKTGEAIWQSRLGGDFSGSPILAANRIYCFDEQGKGHVYSVDGKELAVNTLDSGSLASPIAVGNDLIVRTRTSLYCFRQ